MLIIFIVLLQYLSVSIQWNFKMKYFIILELIGYIRGGKTEANI